MNRDDIIRMAREAGIGWLERAEGTPEFLERFANLIAAAEREKWQWDDIHSCHPHCDRPACVAVRRAREDEREMCAKVCDERAASAPIGSDEQCEAEDCAFAIRERGAP